MEKETAPTPPSTTQKQKEHDMLLSMLLMRRFEERAAQQYQMGKIWGFCHLYIGQEAVATGAFSAIREDDYVITAYRDHGHAIGLGMQLKTCMAELFGKETGCSKGLGGSMHFFDKKRNLFGGHAIVGSHIPLATGLAFAAKYRNEDRVTLCFFGDGAISQGAFHEALNMAELYKLPIVFICENNGYAMGTSVARSVPLKEIHHRARGYAMEHSAVDGMDVRVVRDHLFKIVEKIRKNPRPHFLEARTYRYRGHSMSDPAQYRTKEELENKKKQDPLLLFKDQLIKEGTLTEEEYKTMDTQAKQLAVESVQFAEQSAQLPVEKLPDYV